MHLRTEKPPLCGRDHLQYRSYYWPVKVCNLVTGQDYIVVLENDIIVKEYVIGLVLFCFTECGRW